MIKIKNCVPLWWIDNYTLICYKKDSFFTYDINKREFLFLVKMVFDSRIKRVLTKFTFFRRTFRLYPYSFTKIGENLFAFSMFGNIYTINLETKQISLENKLRYSARRTLSILSCSSGIFYGEYPTLNNTKVGIFKRDDNGSWKIVYEFRSGEIRHIHQLLEHKNNIYCFTGDEDKEVKIIKFDNSFCFSSMVTLVSGSQNFRTCAACFYKDSIYFFSDTPYSQNYLTKLNLSDMSIKHIEEIPGSVIYSSELFENSLIFSTCVENNLSKTSDNKNKKIKIKHGIGGIQSKKAKLCLFNLHNKKISKIYELRKDILPFKFGLGTFIIPRNNSQKYVAASSSGLRKNETIYIFSKENL